MSSLYTISDWSETDLRAWSAHGRDTPSGCRPPAKGVLSKGHVHVWRASLDVSEDRLLELKSLLSPDELSRAGRLRFDSDRRQFIAARAILRTLLGGYLDLNPCLVQFSYSVWGKPYLSSTHRPGDLHFNLSHSDGLALYAVARVPVGIDLERICPLIEWEDIARRFLTPAQISYLSALPVQARQEAFFGLWTRQEAYAKATGEGLAAFLEGSDSLALCAPPRSVPARNASAGRHTTWAIHQLCPGPGYAAALAVRGRCRQIDFWQVSLPESELT